MPDALAHRKANDEVVPLRTLAPAEVFAAAYRELCTRIWIELEKLAQLAAQFERGGSNDLTLRAAILRLEVVILIDSCGSPHWRRLLAAEHCDRLCALLTGVLAALYVEQEQLRAGIAVAQDRLLEELLPQSAEQARALGDAA